MTHKCEKCGNVFDIARHEIHSCGNAVYIKMGTGKHMVYKGDMNREYAMCPRCGQVEHQYSAEGRDQDEMAKSMDVAAYWNYGCPSENAD